MDRKSWLKFQSVWNNYEKYPTVDEVAEALNSTYQAVASKAKRYRSVIRQTMRRECHRAHSYTRYSRQCVPGWHEHAFKTRLHEGVIVMGARSCCSMGKRYCATRAYHKWRMAVTTRKAKTWATI